MVTRTTHLCFINQFSKKKLWLASTASDRKGAKIQLDISWFYPKILFFQNIKIKLNSRTWMTYIKILKWSLTSVICTPFYFWPYNKTCYCEKGTYALSFYWSKMFWTGPNCFGQVQIVLVRSKVQSSGSNILVRFKL